MRERDLLLRALPMLSRLGDFTGNGPVDAARPGSLGARCDLIGDIKDCLGVREAERSDGSRYVLCAGDDVPARVRFDVPGRNQGQHVEVAYGGYSRGENDDGSPYKRVTDWSDGKVTYYRLTLGTES